MCAAPLKNRDHFSGSKFPNISLLNRAFFPLIMYTFREGNSAIFSFASLLNGGQGVCFFSLFEEGLVLQGSKQEVKKVVPLGKNGAAEGIHINP